MSKHGLQDPEQLQAQLELAGVLASRARFELFHQRLDEAREFQLQCQTVQDNCKKFDGNEETKGLIDELRAESTRLSKEIEDELATRQRFIGAQQKAKALAESQRLQQNAAYGVGILVVAAAAGYIGYRVAKSYQL